MSDDIRECPECSVQDQWSIHGVLNKQTVVGCDNCSHIEYLDFDLIYLNEEHETLEPFYEHRST